MSMMSLDDFIKGEKMLCKIVQLPIGQLCLPCRAT